MKPLTAAFTVKTSQGPANLPSDMVSSLSGIAIVLDTAGCHVVEKDSGKKMTFPHAGAISSIEAGNYLGIKPKLFFRFKSILLTGKDEATDEYEVIRSEADSEAERILGSDE